MTTIYHAHSVADQDESHWQTLVEHAKNVGERAAAFATVFGAADMAQAVGQLHDLGKYSTAFQARLRGGPPVDHATAGAKIALERWGQPMGKLMAFCIAGHHAGLANGRGAGNGRQTLQERLNLSFGSGIPPLDKIWQRELPLPATLPTPSLRADGHHPYFSYAFFTRMLYSCLVDADFLDTEAFYGTTEGRKVMRGNYPSLAALQSKFQHFLDNLNGNSEITALNQLRRDILHYATEQAAQAPGFFSLTVPTGGGKTFTSMAFALEHARHYDFQRIIYVIPFTSIIEQNAKAFRQAFGTLGGAVLEHHSNFNDSKLADKSSKDKLRLASENWDAPIVVSTAVQFFESLFADRPGRCRKLHNIAGSVIILDEAQLLPLALLRPCVQALKELAQNYHCSIVLCTATQPALQAEDNFYRGLDNVREIAPNPTQLFAQLRHTTLRHIGQQSDAELLAKLAEYQQILIIVNNRRHARSLYDQAAPLGGVFHLSTLMCAEHRSQILDHIRTRLRANEPCRVIATSLIEAGVDVDFPLVMRAEAGLDSVAQAAGRCNREGRRTAAESSVWVFQPEERWPAPAELAQPAAVMRLIAHHYGDDLFSIPAITAYFRELYALKGSDLDRRKILKMHSDAGNSLDFPFQTIAKEFRVIDSPLRTLIIPFNRKARTLLYLLNRASQIGGLLRALQPYTVQIPEKALMAMATAGRIEIVNEAVFGQQFYALIGLDLYDSGAGLSWENLEFVRAEGLVVC